jgi:hypothetical protein
MLLSSPLYGSTLSRCCGNVERYSPAKIFTLEDEYHIGEPLRSVKVIGMLLM